jgi:hypothetical protein
MPAHKHIPLNTSYIKLGVLERMLVGFEKKNKNHKG